MGYKSGALTGLSSPHASSSAPSAVYFSSISSSIFPAHLQLAFLSLTTSFSTITSHPFLPDLQTINFHARVTPPATHGTSSSFTTKFSALLTPSDYATAFQSQAAPVGVSAASPLLPSLRSLLSSLRSRFVVGVEFAQTF